MGTPSVLNSERNIVENKFKDVIEDKRKIGVQVIAYSGKFKEYIVFPSMASASTLFEKTVKGFPEYIRKYYLDTGKCYKRNIYWKMTAQIPEEWFIKKGFKLVDKYNATFRINTKGEPYKYKLYPKED